MITYASIDHIIVPGSALFANTKSNSREIITILFVEINPVNPQNTQLSIPNFSTFSLAYI